MRSLDSIYRERAIARTFERTRDPQYAPDVDEPETLSGADAKRGDTVRNLTTGEVATVTGASQFGRIIVNGGPKWERYNVEVIAC